MHNKICSFGFGSGTEIALAHFIVSETEEKKFEF